MLNYILSSKIKKTFLVENSKIHFFREAISMARHNWNKTLPNPCVGAVVVKGGQILGKGHTLPPGQDHGEIQAIKSTEAAGHSCEGADMFVMLEPCSHHGRTPPCSQAIIHKKFRKVYIGVLDPNPLVSGKGIQQLRDNGVEVEVCEDEEIKTELEEMYAGFFAHITHKRPYITIKLAQSANHCIAASDKSPVAITGPEVKSWVYEKRALADTIMVSSSTLRQDNPTLNVGLPDFKGKQPDLALFGNNLEFKGSQKIFQVPSRRILAFSPGPLLSNRVEHFLFPHDEILDNLVWTLQKLHEGGCHHIFVEPGAVLTQLFLQHGIFDQFFLFTSSKIIENGYNWQSSFPDWEKRYETMTELKIGPDLLQTYVNKEFKCLPDLSRH